MRPGFKRRAVLIGIVTLTLAGVLALFGLQMIQRVDAVQDRWAAYNKQAAEAQRILDLVSRNMGYGGFIHHFKNFVLRQDMDYLPLVIEKRDAIYEDINQLKVFVIRDEEKDALRDLRSVFDEYAVNIAVATNAMKSGLKPVEVDKLVKVDDTPALAAIAVLYHSFLTRRRIAESEINRATSAASSMGWIILAAMPVVIGLGFMLIMFLRRVTVANANLSEVRDELSMLLRQAPDAILHVAGDGSILRANDRALTLFGYSNEEFQGKRVEDLIPNRFSTQHTGQRKVGFDQVAQRPGGKGAVMTAKTRSGEDIPVDISLNFTMSSGKRIATVIVRDITERKRAEDALRQARDELEQRVRERTRELVRRTGELEGEIAERKRAETQLVQSAKMATIGQMASGITHELNQPMNIMRMGVEAAQLQVERGQADISSLSETLEKVEGQILRMSEIINHMRVYARQDRDTNVVFNAFDAVQEGCKLFEGQLMGLDIKLITEIPSCKGAIECCAVLGHATRMEQVVLNLLSNARDAILEKREKTGQDFTGETRVKYMADETAQEVVIEVEDNGGGISDDVLPHIFAPFVTTKDSGQGTGLGLSISYSIVEGMGGSISATNGETGACITMRFPMASEEQIERANALLEQQQHTIAEVAPHVVAVSGDRHKVLVVDDETNAAHSLSDFLQDQGYLVYTAYNGEEALHIHHSDPVDAIITDLRMPVMGGQALIREVRKVSPMLPVFVMTGHADPESDELVQDVEVVEVWRKPISLGAVAKRLDEVCSLP
ncbi:ATP-binding protein [Magnetovibrio sp. PR-2]|uniref:hybrid sensor histidine kinase/response regulator n=1 Tax=Magnetovibrio sp. PR-2 TaxID=3120356 RepID=UPI002FCE206D